MTDFLVRHDKKQKKNDAKTKFKKHRGPLNKFIKNFLKIDAEVSLRFTLCSYVKNIV